MHLGARGFVHAELIDPETGRGASSWRTARRGELVLTHLRHRAAPLLRFRTRDHVARPDEPVPVRPHRPARALHRPHRRHADRARRQRLPVGRARGGERVRAAGQRPHPRPAAARRASSRSRRCRSAVELAPRRGGRRRARRRRSATGCAACSSSRPASSSCRGGACSAASTSRSSSSTRREEEADAEAPEPGRAPHHDRRRRPADVDRLLGGRARHAVRVRAAEPRQRVREPPLLRPGRRPADHDLHQRGARGRPGAARRPIPAACTTSRSRSRRRPSARRSSGSTSAASSHSGVKDRGFMDSIYFTDPLGPADRARVLPLRAAVRLHARRRAARGAQDPRRARRLQHRPRCTSRTPSRRSSRRSRESLSDDRSPKDPY